MNKQNIQIPLTGLFSLLFLSACCSARVNILPKGGNNAQVISTSRNSSCCIEKGKKEAQEYCAKKGKSLVVIDEKTDYNGADRTAKAFLTVLTRKSVDTSSDYTSTMNIKCE